LVIREGSIEFRHVFIYFHALTAVMHLFQGIEFMTPITTPIAQGQSRMSLANDMGKCVINLGRR